MRKIQKKRNWNVPNGGIYGMNYSPLPNWERIEEASFRRISLSTARAMLIRAAQMLLEVLK